MIDLHIHSTISDGTYTPLEILEEASKKGLTQISITDHNTYKGSIEALKYINDFPNINLVIGCELSSYYYGREAHVLGYFNKTTFDSHLLDEFLYEDIREKENAQKAMVKKLQELGISISYEELLETFPDTMINRTHISRLLKEKGIVNSITEGFEKYVGFGKPCFVDRKYKTLADVISIIHKCNGVAIKAHSFVDKPEEVSINKYLKQAFNLGMDGAEAVHSSHSELQAKIITSICNKYNKIITGGSDFHGQTKPNVQLGLNGISDIYKILI